MKVKITNDGAMVVSPETDAEIYILKKWVEAWPASSRLLVGTVGEINNRVERIGYVEVPNA